MLTNLEKIIIIGKKIFVGSNLYFFLKKKKQKVLLINYNDFVKKKNKFLNSIDYIINCSINSNYINNKYNVDNDFDLKIAKKIKKTSIKLIFLSTRKVYAPKSNIKEKNKLNPKSNYSKNKLITEKKLFKILKDKVLILRISNLIGINKYKHRKMHNTFINIFFDLIKKNIIINNKNIFKDFLPINKFCKITYFLIKKKTIGIFNVSLGQKVYLKELIRWLNYFNPKKCKIVKIKKNFNKDSFYLNNHKLKKHLKINIKKSDLKKYCLQISKNFFKNNSAKFQQ